MRYVLAFFLLFTSLHAGFVELKNGKLIEGIAYDKGSQVSIAGKSYSLKEISSYELDKPLGDDGGEFIIFKDGSIIKATVTKFNKSSGALEAEVSGLDKKIALKDVRAISFLGSRYPVYKATGNKRLFTKIGIPVEGDVSYFTRTLVGVKTSSIKRYKKTTLSAYIFDDGEIPKTQLSIFTTSREVYCGKLVAIKGDVIVVENALGQTEIPSKRIVRFNLSPGQMLDLDEKSIKSINQTPYFDSVRKVSFNKSYTGNDIRLRGLALSNFVELHTKTEMKIKLPKGAISFNAEGFIDPSATNGDLELKILLKGKEVFKTRVRSGSNSSKIKVKVKGHSEMTLIADFGLNGSSGDYLILARPLFLLEKHK